MLTDGEMPWKASFLILIFFVSFAGNILVILVVYRSRRNQWTTNYFVVSLAIVNLLASSVYLFFTLDFAFRNEWMFMDVGCKLNAFVAHFNALASVATLCCMSVDRYYLTAYPFTSKLSKSQTKKVILIVWFLAMSVACPMAYFYEIHSTKSQDCLPGFSDRWTAYFCCFVIVFLLPHLTTYATYTRVYFCIRARNENLRNAARFAQKVPRTKIKVTKLLVAQVIVHSVLWLPYITFQLVTSVSKQSNTTSAMMLTYLAYASSAASPVIYTVFSGDFRRGCKLIFIKYDASKAYRLPAQLERKNRIHIMVSGFGPQTSTRGASTKRDSTELTSGMTVFEQHRIAWSDI